MTTARYAASSADVAALLNEMGEPAYRSRQVMQGIWQQRLRLEDITNVAKPLLAALANRLPYALRVDVEQRSAHDQTTKWLLHCERDGAQIETVLMQYESRATVCISSQAGCAMGCTFCATGQAGFERHLDVAEIVEQVARAQHSCSQRIGNVVFMGMGEPLANVEPVLGAIERLHGGFGISARHITVSTVGVVPGIARLAEFPLPVRLAVSIHAADDALRDRLVPLNRRYPLADVLDAARHYADSTGRRVTFEYALIEGVNDSPALAGRLADRLTGLRGGTHVNLIPLNPTSHYGGTSPGRSSVESFAQRLSERGVNVTVRRNRGTDIDAACGQLRSRTNILG